MLVVDDRHLVPLAPSSSIVRTKFVPVQPKSHDGAHDPALPDLALALDLRARVDQSGFGSSDSTYGPRLAPSKT